MRQVIITIAAVIFAAGTVSAGTHGKTICVDADAAGANNGTTWADAYKFLQDALADASSSEKPVEIRVAQGVYQPDSSAAEPNGTGDRNATFQLIRGVALKGGYAGFGHPDPNARDFELYETVLSGDLDSNDLDVNGPADLRDEPSRVENAYHVVTSRDSDESAVLDGMTITGGNANGDWPDPWPYEERGGGMYNEGGGRETGGRGGPITIEYAATISNCTFVGNSAAFGGGMYNYQSYPKVLWCSFISNSSPFRLSGDVGRGGTGGGIHNAESSPMITNCLFRGNSAVVGGGMSNERSYPVVSLCTFLSNAAHLGGGVYGYWSSPHLNGCVFNKNSAESWGGGVANRSSSPSVTNCIFSENWAHTTGGGMANEGGSPEIMDCIFTANSSQNWGGGVSNNMSDVVLARCVFAGNRGRRFGGAVENTRCEPVMANCTIVLNRAGETGGGVRCGYGSYGLLRNSILWGNSAPKGREIAVDGVYEAAKMTVEYCLVMGGESAVHAEPNDSLDWGAGNIDYDPCFADLGYWDPNGTPEDTNDDFWVDGEYHLKSQAGRWDANEGRWTIDNVTSPCIDAGDPMSPIGLEPFPNGGIINMGAYGSTPEASKSYFGKPLCETIVAGDVNGDCVVDFRDFFFIALHWLEER